MKKTYKKPSTREVRLNSLAILAGSPNDGINVNPNEDVNTMESKGNSIWHWSEDAE